MARAGLWLRVSKGEQDTENQRPQLEAWAGRRGDEVVVVYTVEQSAYAGNHRATLAQAVEDARLRRYEVLYIWALDRLSREGPEATLRALRQFRDHGVQVVSLQEPWLETVGAAGELLVSILGWLAQQESARKSERVKAGLERRRAEGLPVGRQPGAKDKKPRKRSGYYRRWEAERDRASERSRPGEPG